VRSKPRMASLQAPIMRRKAGDHERQMPAPIATRTRSEEHARKRDDCVDHSAKKHRQMMLLPGARRTRTSRAINPARILWPQFTSQKTEATQRAGKIQEAEVAGPRNAPEAA